MKLNRSGGGGVVRMNGKFRSKPWAGVTEAEEEKKGGGGIDERCLFCGRFLPSSSVSSIVCTFPEKQKHT